MRTPSKPPEPEPSLDELHPVAVLQTFYRQVSAPLLRRITVQFPEDSVSDVTQNYFDKYFSGSELVVAGKVLPSESTSLTSYISASAVSPDFFSLDLETFLPCTFYDHNNKDIDHK